MGRGGVQTHDAPPSLSSPPPSTHLSTSTASSTQSPNPSIRLQYPKSSRLLLGTTANLQQPGFLKALETNYPLELSLSCDALTPPPKLFPFPRPLRPFAMFFYRDTPHAQWELIGRTETVLHDVQHRFVTKLKVCCATSADRAKVLRVEVYDRRTRSELVEDQIFLGAAECTLEDIIAEPLLRRRMRLVSSRVTHPGWITLAADVVRPVAGGGKITMNIDMSSITKGTSRVFFVLSRQGFGGEYTPLYRSEILGKAEKRFKPLTREVCAVTAGVDDKLLRIEMFQWSKGGSVRLGFVQTTLEKLRSTEVNGSLLWWPCGSGEGRIEIGRVVLIEKDVAGNVLKVRLRVTT